jgi:hypothetical protein
VPEPEAPAFEEPEAEAAPEAAPAPPPLVLRLEVDFENREARLRLDEDSPPVRLTFESGAWRVDPSTKTDEGGSQ